MDGQDSYWLLIDGYEDEPAAFGVPPYIGFHCRYIAGVLEKKNIPYKYLTIDQWRLKNIEDQNKLAGLVILAGAVVPGKYLRGTPISLNETERIISNMPTSLPILCGGWAIRGWRHRGWNPLRKNLFLAHWDTDATLNNFLENQQWKHLRRTAEQWDEWANAGASSKAVLEHPDLNGPLTYEVEVYQGCVRFKNGCKFCLEPKKGVPLWRSPEAILSEIKNALDSGVKNIRLGGMTDVYTYLADGVKELEYPIPNPKPLEKLLYGIREDERVNILHVDNGNPSIIAENIEPSTEITKILVDTLSDGAILSFGLESVDPEVHSSNWLNCDPEQAKVAIRLINKFGKEKGERGLPKLLPGLNFIAGLNGEIPEKTYKLNLDFLSELKKEGLWLRRINIRQVEGEGFQEIPPKEFKEFKSKVRDEFDGPLLEEMFPIGTLLKDVWWESHDNRTRLPVHLTDKHCSNEIHGNAGITFGRQIGAYPILIGAEYHIPLETQSNVLVTGHGKRSITAVETNLDINSVSQHQLASIPGIGEKTAWKIISAKAKRLSKNREKNAFENLEDAFSAVNIQIPELAYKILN